MRSNVNTLSQPKQKQFLMMVRLQEVSKGGEGDKRARDIVEIGPYSIFCLHFIASRTNITKCHLMGTQSPQ